MLMLMLMLLPHRLHLGRRDLPAPHARVLPQSMLTAHRSSFTGEVDVSDHLSMDALVRRRATAGRVRGVVEKSAVVLLHLRELAAHLCELGRETLVHSGVLQLEIRDPRLVTHDLLLKIPDLRHP